ncbi:acetyl-CoA C-acetyltransferase [Haliangium ochraceum]|uniref:Acetyl-CoA acetyltransferase n=1 Tax=Haliangium ochraceum (strain DSM 14365 / JCM 11303 / SMP-2) TaxID=502025 RepID=D0LWW0_HALO1|nr:acetyl-CoA C-acetyltransferase [Haliangium ochraceum]ACY14207.1 acetyl-CoA acetyltransferase [Haliangium ochraceum DSM 14365]
MEAYIYDHVRTPRGRGRAEGSLHEITPIQLAAQTLSALRERNELDTALVDDVILGCVSPVGEQGANLGRVAALRAGFAETVAGQQINRFCASALEAVNLGAAVVHAGAAQAVIAGGVESMSRVRMGSDGGPWYSDPQTTWACGYSPQGIGADLLATLDGYSRDDLDVFALASQQRAARAWKQKYFRASIVPVCDLMGEIVLDHDEHMRPDTRPEDLARLRPAFAAMGESQGFDAVALQRYPEVERIEHLHTGGNSSGIVDGAAAVLIGDRDFGRATGMRPRARIRGFRSIGSEPTLMLSGPGPCSRQLLERLGMHTHNIDLFEVNEAFAAVALRFMRDMEIEHDKTNVNGGAIAMGHPLGATGAMLLGIALDELERRQLSTALVTLCAAAGMATATVIERV